MDMGRPIFNSRNSLSMAAKIHLTMNCFLAGQLLLEFSPSCPLELDGAIYAIPAFWDYSIEEVPWYLCKNFGKVNVVKFLTEIIPEVEEGNVIKQSFKTLLFWSKSYVA